MTNILANPVVIALAVGVLTYLYLVWSSSKVVKKTKKGKKKVVQQAPGYVIPIAIALVTWVLVYCYQEYYCKEKTPSNPVTQSGKYSLKKVSSSGSEGQRSFRMIRTGVSVPRGMADDDLPDVFINAIN
jgi:hypothetical protein